MIVRWKYIFLVTASIFLETSAQFLDGYCQTPREQRGFCINIVSCQPLLELLKSYKDPQVMAYLQSSTCGYDGKYPLVCCPDSSESPGKTLPDDTTTSSTTLAPVMPPSGSSSNYHLYTPPQCGLSNMGSTRVVNGMNAKLGEFPWIAALGYRNNDNAATPKWLCGGTLITEKHIVTAGHCVYNRPDLYLARLGELDLYNDKDGASPVDVLIDRAKVHEAYSSISFTNDIAILTLSQTVGGPNIRPICISIGETRTFEKYYPWVAGWGAIYFNGPTSSILKVAMLPVISNNQCQQNYASFKTTVIDNRVLCAGYSQGGKDACQGDSGGPLMWAKVDGNNIIFYLIGVVSYGFKCAEANYPGVYTRVSSFTDWIQQNLN